MSRTAAFSFQIGGRVQGVGFRAFVLSTGQQYGLDGWVKNQMDGTVIGWVQGDAGLVLEFLKQLQIGNRWSDVGDLRKTPVKVDSGLKEFEIRY